MDAKHIEDDLVEVLLTEEQIQTRLAELADEVWEHYEGKDVLLVGVLKGAVMVMADFMRHLPGSAPMDWMAVSSYGSGTKSSGVVRILKDLDADITDRHVLIVEDIIDSGLTLSWIRANLESRAPASVEILTRRREGRDRHPLGRLRHRQQVRRRLRPRLRRGLPQPARGGHPRAARLLLILPAGRAGGTAPREGRGNTGEGLLVGLIAAGGPGSGSFVLLPRP